MSLIKKRKFDDGDEWTTADNISIVWKKLFESGKKKLWNWSLIKSTWVKKLANERPTAQKTLKVISRMISVPRG